MAGGTFFWGKHFAAGSNGGLVSNQPTGLLHCVTINAPGSAATITVYDSTTGSGNVLAAISGFTQPVTLFYDDQVTTGIFVVLAGTTQADVTISYR